MRLFLPTDFGFSSFSSALFRNFGVCDQYTTIETPLLCIIKPPLYKELWIFLCIFHHLQFSFANNSLIELSSFDLKVSQVSFSVKENSLPHSNSRLHFCHCFWFESSILWSVESSFQVEIKSVALSLPFVSQIRNLKVSSYPSFHFLNSKSQSIVLALLSFFEFEITKCRLCLPFAFEKKIVSIVALRKKLVRMCT